MPCPDLLPFHVQQELSDSSPRSNDATSKRSSESQYRSSIFAPIVTLLHKTVEAVEACFEDTLGFPIASARASEHLAHAKRAYFGELQNVRCFALSCYELNRTS